MKNSSTLSALLINYNHGKYLSKNLNVIFSQTVPFDEVIIIDDCSSDKSVQIIKKIIKGKDNTKFIKNDSNLGIFENLNIGTNLCSSKYIYFLSADDDYNIKLVEYFHDANENYPDVAMISGNVSKKISKTNKIISLKLPFVDEMILCNPISYFNLSKRRPITFFGGGNFIRKDIIIKSKLFRPELKWYADWMIYQLIGFKFDVAIIHKNIMNVNIRDDSFSNAAYNWEEQKGVLIKFLEVLEKEYSSHYQLFKNTATLPSYDFQCIFLLFTNKNFQKFFSLLLLWRILTYSLFRKIGFFTPQKFHNILRYMLRV